MTPVHFGPSVQGAKNYDEAVRNEKGGGNVFGVRVRGAIPEDGPTNTAKRASEFGVNVLDGAHASNTKGEPSESLSIDELRNVLAENPTFFDSLYEAELARAGGARTDALAIFYEIERGIKGAMREDVMREIRNLLGQKGIDAAALADRAKAMRTQQQEQAQRAEENRLLGDADRIKALKEREENLKIVRDGHSKSGRTQMVAEDSESQVRSIAARDGLSLGGENAGTTAAGKVPTKPDGDVHTESQQPGQRLNVPKGTEGTDGEGSGQDESSPARGAGDEDEKGKRKQKAEKFKAELREYPKDKLEADLRKAVGDEQIDAIEGSGSTGAVVKEDLATFAVAGIEAGTLDTNRSGYIVASS